MAYLDNIDDNVERMEELLAHMELALENNWSTVYGLATNNFLSILKCTQFCVRCAKSKADKIGIPYHEFKCVGGCIKGGTLDAIKQVNKNIWRMFHLRGR